MFHAHMDDELRSADLYSLIKPVTAIWISCPHPPSSSRYRNLVEAGLGISGVLEMQDEDADGKEQKRVFR